MSDKVNIRVDDTTSVNMNMKGDGSNVTPFVLESDVIISPADNNQLKNDGNGLFVENNSYPITVVSEVFNDVATGDVIELSNPVPVESTKLFVYSGGLKLIEGVDYILVGQGIHFTLDAENFPISTLLVEIYKFAPFEVTSEVFNNNTSGDTINITKTLPSDTSLVQVFGDGQKKIETVDYNISGQDIVFITNFDTEPYNTIEVLVYTNK